MKTPATNSTEINASAMRLASGAERRGGGTWQNHRKQAKIRGEPVLLFDNSPSGSHPTVELLTIPEVAEFLKISLTGVRRLQQKRNIPFTKVGGSVRFFASDIITYLEKRRVKSIG